MNRDGLSITLMKRGQRRILFFDVMRIFPWTEGEAKLGLGPVYLYVTLDPQSRGSFKVHWGWSHRVYFHVQIGGNWG